MSGYRGFNPYANEAAKQWVELEIKYGIRKRNNLIKRVELAIFLADRSSRPFAGLSLTAEKPRSVHAMGQRWNRFDLFLYR